MRNEYWRMMLLEVAGMIRKVGKVGKEDERVCEEKKSEGNTRGLGVNGKTLGTQSGMKLGTQKWDETWDAN